jgi:hypothetical protein
VNVRRLGTIAASLALTVGVTGCHGKAHPHVADNEGIYVDAGPITYQVQLSRPLNQYNTEDKEYLNGIPAGTAPPNKDEEWFAVFLWAKNQAKAPQTTTGNFDIVDTQGTVYKPISIEASVNPFAWTPQPLTPSETQPQPDNLAATSPTQGEELLFKINNSAYANRPLTLEIRGGTQELLATVSLDL